MSSVFRPSDAQQLYQRLRTVSENPEVSFTRKLTHTKRELRNIVNALESQQSSVRVASGVTGTTTLLGIGISFLLPPIGLGVAALGATGFAGSQVADVALNTIHNDRLKALLDLDFENEISNLLQLYGIDQLTIQSLREVRDADFNAVGSLWSKIVAIATTIQNATNGPLRDELTNLRGNYFIKIFKLIIVSDLTTFRTDVLRRTDLAGISELRRTYSAVYPNNYSVGGRWWICRIV